MEPSEPWVGFVGALGGPALGLLGTYFLGRRDQSHASREAKEARKHEHALEWVRVQRDAIAPFRREYARYNEHRDEDFSHNQDEARGEHHSGPVEEPLEAREIMRELVYWQALLPRDLRELAVKLLAAHHAEAKSLARFVVGTLRPNDLEDGIKVVDDWRKARDAFNEAADKWMDSQGRV